MKFFRKLMDRLLGRKTVPFIHKKSFSHKAYRLHIDGGLQEFLQQKTPLDWIGYPEFNYKDIDVEKSRLAATTRSQLMTSFYNEQAKKSAKLACETIEKAMRTSSKAPPFPVQTDWCSRTPIAYGSRPSNPGISNGSRSNQHPRG